MSAGRRLRRCTLELLLVAMLLLALAAGQAQAAEAPGAISEFVLPHPFSAGGYITSESNGVMWFAEAGRQAIGEMSMYGALINEFPVAAPRPESETEPWAIAMGPSDEVWFTTDYPGSVERMNARGEITLDLRLDGGESQPEAIVEGSEHDMWITVDAGTVASIDRVTPTGEVTSYPIPAKLGGAAGIVLGPEHDLWFTESGANKIGRITPTGTITEFSIPTAESYPRGIALGLEGDLWFTEQASDRIGKVTPEGTFNEYSVPTPDGQPLDIATGAEGDLWFTEAMADRIGRITPAGAISERILPAGNPGGWGITAGPNEAIWFSQGGECSAIDEIVPGATGPGTRGACASTPVSSGSGEKSSPPSPSPQPTTASMRCSLQPSRAEDLCRFSVSNSNASPSVGAPSGTVPFDLAGGDRFGAGGGSCTLAATGPAASACTVHVLPPVPDYAPVNALQPIAAAVLRLAGVAEQDAKDAENASAAAVSARLRAYESAYAPKTIIEEIHQLASRLGAYTNQVKTYAARLKQALQEGNPSVIDPQASSVSSGLLAGLQSLTSDLLSVGWSGPNYDRFRSQWEDSLTPMVKEAANSLIRDLRTTVAQVGGAYGGDPTHSPSTASAVLPPITALAADASVAVTGTVTGTSAAVPVSCQFACLVIAELQTAGSPPAGTAKLKKQVVKKSKPRAVLLGRGVLRLAAPGSGHLLIKLSAKGRSLLRSRGREVTLKLTIETVDGTVVSTKGQPVLLRPRKQHAKH